MPWLAGTTRGEGFFSNNDAGANRVKYPPDLTSPMRPGRGILCIVVVGLMASPGAVAQATDEGREEPLGDICPNLCPPGVQQLLDQVDVPGIGTPSLVIRKCLEFGKPLEILTGEADIWVPLFPMGGLDECGGLLVKGDTILDTILELLQDL